MSPTLINSCIKNNCFPRMRGDEPDPKSIAYEDPEFSPHARG